MFMISAFTDVFSILCAAPVFSPAFMPETYLTGTGSVPGCPWRWPAVPQLRDFSQGLFPQLQQMVVYDSLFSMDNHLYFSCF